MLIVSPRRVAQHRIWIQLKMLTSAGKNNVFLENKDKHPFYSNPSDAGSYIQRKGDMFQFMHHLLFLSHLLASW